MNVLRYCYLDESLQGYASLVCDNALERLFRTKELDYMSYIVLRMFENTEVGSLCLHPKWKIRCNYISGNNLTIYDHTAHLLFITDFTWMQVSLEDPKRYRIELTFSRGADLSPLEVFRSYSGKF